jgi:type II secretory pathway component PulF
VGGGWQMIRGMHGASAIAVFALIPVGIATYGIVLWLLRIEGRSELEAMLARMPVIGRLFRPAL